MTKRVEQHPARVPSRARRSRSDAKKWRMEFGDVKMTCALTIHSNVGTAHDSEVVNSSLVQCDLVGGQLYQCFGDNTNKILEKEVESCIRYLVPMALLLGSFPEH